MHSSEEMEDMKERAQKVARFIKVGEGLKQAEQEGKLDDERSAEIQADIIEVLPEQDGQIPGEDIPEIVLAVFNIMNNLSGHIEQEIDVPDRVPPRK